MNKILLDWSTGVVCRKKKTSLKARRCLITKIYNLRFLRLLTPPSHFHEWKFLKHQLTYIPVSWVIVICLELDLGFKMKLKRQTWDSVTCQSNGLGSLVTIKACGPLTSLFHQILNSTFCYMYLQPKHIFHFLIEKLQ